MLEGFRKHSQSLMLIVLVASVATIFGVGFGPGAQGCQSGSLQVTYAARVWGRTLNDADFVSALSSLQSFIPPFLADNPAVVGAARQGALDGLIERELLAHEAERLGMRVTEQQVSDEFRNCRFYVTVGVGAEDTIGIRSGLLPLPASMCGGVGDAFDYNVFERTARRFFRRTVNDLRASTERELLAERMRNAVRASVQVSDEELWREYQRTHDQMAVKYLRFNLAFYRNLVRDDDPEQVATWAVAHEADISTQWLRRRDALRGLRREIRVRHILVRYPDDATDAQKAEARAKADWILAQIRTGGDFVRMARLYSDDPGSWRAGGELGWRQPDGAQGYVAEFTQAANALQVGGISPVTETQFGCHIIQLLGVREGDVSELEGKRDLARTMFRDARATELAQEASAAALTALRSGNFDEVARGIGQAALREFFRGEVPAPVTLRPGLTLAPVERTDLDAPAPRESELFARNGMVVSDLEHGESLTRAAFGLTDAAPLVAAPLHVGDDWFVLRYKDGSRTVATREEFARQRQELLSTTYASMLAARQRQALVAYIARLRQEAEHANQVRIGNSPRLRPSAENAEE